MLVDISVWDLGWTKWRSEDAGIPDWGLNLLLHTALQPKLMPNRTDQVFSVLLILLATQKPNPPHPLIHSVIFKFIVIFKGKNPCIYACIDL